MSRESTTTELGDRMERFRDHFRRLLNEIQRAIVGYEDLITDTLVALFSQGHVLLEGVPGLGKTYLVRVISRVLGLNFGRVQCTPDLMPPDILGTHIVDQNRAGRRSFRFEKGPVFNNLLLVDEINRATPKTQAALLEVMQEHAMEGTYPLPEAQLDRFLFKLLTPFPGHGELVEISRRTTKFTEPELDVVMTGPELIDAQELLTHVPVADPLTEYGASLVLASHPERPESIPTVRRFVSYGASPRGLQALVRGARAHCLLSGRTAISVGDIQRVAKQSLRHRLILNFEGEAESLDVDRLVEEIIEEVPTPGKEAA